MRINSESSFTNESEFIQLHFNNMNKANKFLANAFSLQMLKNFPCEIKVSEIAFEDVKLSTLTSAVGHQDTANVLGVECNRINVSLEKGDTLFVAQLQGGRLPEGSTTLPEGFSFKFLKVEIL